MHWLPFAIIAVLLVISVLLSILLLRNQRQLRLQQARDLARQCEVSRLLAERAAGRLSDEKLALALRGLLTIWSALDATRKE